MQIFLDLIFAYGACFKAFTACFGKTLLLLYTYLTLFRKIDFYLVLEDKSSPYNIFTII